MERRIGALLTRRTVLCQTRARWRRDLWTILGVACRAHTGSRNCCRGSGKKISIREQDMSGGRMTYSRSSWTISNRPYGTAPDSTMTAMPVLSFTLAQFSCLTTKSCIEVWRITSNRCQTPKTSLLLTPFAPTHSLLFAACSRVITASKIIQSAILRCHGRSLRSLSP